MRIIKLFKNHVLALVCAVALIVISCNADLALPTYMSEIVDVGIQQGGIESPAPDTIRAESLSDLELFMPEDDMATVEAAYSEPEAGRAEDGAVSDAISLPETVVLSLEQGVDASTVADGMTGTLDMQTVRGACEAGIIPKEKLVEAASAMSDSIGSMGGSIVKQRAVTFMQQEYEAQGISLTDVQNSYLASMSLKMFGLCAVSLVATILTGAVASHTACTIARDLRRQTFDRVMHFSPAEVGKFSQASLITRCTNDIQQIQMATTLFIRMVLMAPIMGVVAVMRVLATHTGLEWTIGVAVIAVCAVVGVVAFLDVPLVFMSARIWRSIHPAVFGSKGGGLEPDQLLMTNPNGDSIWTFSLGYICRNLPATTKLLLRTIPEQGALWLQGILGTTLGEPIVYRIDVSWLLGVGLILCVVASSLVVALNWTPINYQTLFGLQGRYWLPILPLVLVLCKCGRNITLRHDTSRGAALAVTACTLLTLLQGFGLYASWQPVS